MDSIDVMNYVSYEKAALAKMENVPDNFRFYEAGWLGDKPSEWTVMEVVGAEFRVATRGKNKGKLSVIVPNTKRKVYVTREEMLKFE